MKILFQPQLLMLYKFNMIQISQGSQPLMSSQNDPVNTMQKSRVVKKESNTCQGPENNELMWFIHGINLYLTRKKLSHTQEWQNTEGTFPSSSLDFGSIGFLRELRDTRSTGLTVVLSGRTL